MPYKPSSMTRNEFLGSEVATKLRTELTEMTDSPLYNTKVPALVLSDAAYFIDKHMSYMSNHLKMDHFQYVQNLKLMTKIRR
jgi:hypothetical protein